MTKKVKIIKAVVCSNCTELVKMSNIKLDVNCEICDSCYVAINDESIINGICKSCSFIPEYLICEYEDDLISNPLIVKALKTKSKYVMFYDGEVEIHNTLKSLTDSICGSQTYLDELFIYKNTKLVPFKYYTSTILEIGNTNVEISRDDEEDNTEFSLIIGK